MALYHAPPQRPENHLPWTEGRCDAELAIGKSLLSGVDTYCGNSLLVWVTIGSPEDRK